MKQNYVLLLVILIIALVGEKVFSAAQHQEQHGKKRAGKDPAFDKKPHDSAAGSMTGEDHESSAEGTVVVFTAWGRFNSIAQYKPRIDHHVAYTSLHGYKYVIFVGEDISSTDKEMLGKGVEVIVVPGFLDRTDQSPHKRPLQTGWLKIDGFQLLLARFRAPALFFYVDMDVIFHNFQVSLSSVLRGKSQSVFVQDKQANRMFSPSHAVAIRHSPAARRFVEDWASQLPLCPHLNMEQGAWKL